MVFVHNREEGGLLGKEEEGRGTREEREERETYSSAKHVFLLGRQSAFLAPGYRWGPGDVIH